MEIYPCPEGLALDEDHPQHAVVLLAGNVVAQGEVLAIDLHHEEHTCANPDCINNCLADHYLVMRFHEAPPREAPPSGQAI